MKEPITKNLKKEPVKWSVTHPEGHLYSMFKLDDLLVRFDRTQQEMEALGWRFEPHFTK